MQTENILAHVNKVVQLDEQEEQKFKAALEFISVAKKTMLLAPGNVCKGSWYVIKGCLRYYKEDERGYEHTLYFAIEDWWIGDLYSKLSQQPSEMYIEVLEDSELVFISNETQEKLYNDVPKFERYFRIMLERNVVANQMLSYNRMASTAHERYTKFIQRYPNLETRISQRQIASYIGVTPEFLSKMKHDIYKKGK
jgi:CRP/FNR family transcriptional regulator, anaerobic regulatory protein